MTPWWWLAAIATALAISVGACRSKDEPPPLRWVDADDDGVAESAEQFPGSEHCDFESLSYLRIDARTYLRDPERLFADESFLRSGNGARRTYAGDATVPDDAAWTGLRRSDGAELWAIDGDESHVWVKQSGSAERWPLADPAPLCR